jgi:AcrR family transcriptional regulator
VVRKDVADIRTQILEATRSVLEKHGLMGATTREIARAAGCAEGTLFNNFGNREGLFLALFLETLPTFRLALGDLALQVGEGEVADTVVHVVTSGLPFFRKVMPLFTGLIADPDLLVAYRGRLKAGGHGPHRAFDTIAAYLRAEQRLGRVSPGLDPQLAATTIVGACFFKAFYDRFMDVAADSEADAVWAKAFVGTACGGWFAAPASPRGSRRKPRARRPT